MSDKQIPASIDDLQSLLAREFYVADRGLATSIYLALTLGRPLLLEGEAGVGKTEVAKVLPRGLAPNDHETEAHKEAHRRTEALLQGGAPRPRPLPTARSSR